MTTAPALDEYSDVELIIARLVNDGRFLLENFTTITDEEGRFIPFQFNHVQHAHYESIHAEVSPGVWVRIARDVVVLKGRQFGATTEIVGLQAHATWFHNWRTAAIAFAEEDAFKIKRRVDVMYESTCDALRDTLHSRDHPFDPYEIMPRWTKDTEHELFDENRGCSQEFFSERTKGAGRSQTRNWIYCTDLSEWMTYSDAIAGLAGSLAKTGLSITDRDGTGKGPGNALHSEYQRALATMMRNPSGPTRAYFYGIDEVGYTERFLADQLEIMGPTRYRREYPRTPADAFTGDPNARFDQAAIELCQKREPRYLVDFMSDEEIMKTCKPSHGIDSAEGTPAGDYATIVSRDSLTGLMILPPWRKQSSPVETALEARRRHVRFPGLLVPERNNHGGTTIRELQLLGLGASIYREHVLGARDAKEGFLTGAASRPILISNYEKVLAETLINLPSENGALEATIFGLQKNGKIEAPPGFHDDELFADMLCCWGFTGGKQPGLLFRGIGS